MTIFCHQAHSVFLQQHFYDSTEVTEGVTLTPEVSCMSFILTEYAIFLLAVYSVQATCYIVDQSKTKCCVSDQDC